VKQERLTLANEEYKQLTNRLQTQWKASKTSCMRPFHYTHR